MFQKILQLLLILSITSLIYLGNTTIINISLFFLIVLTMINKNYYSFLSIIPLFFINPYSIIIFVVLGLILFVVTNKITNKLIKNCSIFLISIIFLLFEIFINSTLPVIGLYSILIILPALLINTYIERLSKQINIDMLILTISILNVAYVNEYIFLLIISVFITIQSIQFKRPFYIITAFFITIYSITSTNNLIYIFVQILAYLGYLLNFNNIMKNNNNEIEFILEDINLNVATFCNFLNSFSDITYNDDYEKRVSTAIKILIESYCLTCKNRADCYANKKTKTYIYLKELLTKKNQINTKDSKNSIFECKNYFLMVEKALQLQKQYNLLGDAKIDDLKIFGICSSVQSYFVSMFEKISPDMIKLMNFKKCLIEENVLFTNFEHSITNETTFQFKIYAKKIADLLIIKDIAEPYFKKYSVNIDLRDGYINISPKRKFKILYDHAALSLNNCQISGDNILFKTLDDINFLCALSDGMGSGYYAYQLSQETLKMVDNITNCSISFDSSLQILNNFFKTRDLSDSYATLDLININLADGILNLYKLGSSTTYISRGERIVPIYNNNLPFGISDLITKEEYTIADGDLIVLVSDGVNDYINEEVLIKYIESLKNEAPHKIVYEILQKIYYENGSTIKDDMSCIAIKIKKI